MSGYRITFDSAGSIMTLLENVLLEKLLVLIIVHHLILNIARITS